MVLEEGKVKNISYIYSLNFRIAKEVNGSSKELVKEIIDFKNNSIYNTLIVGRPGTGKTTVIRDIAKIISNGNEEFLGLTVGIVDERGEISAMYKGVPQNDLGIRTDILNNVKKSIGIEMLVRSMAPRVIIADEIGSRSDIDAIRYGMCSGVKGIFTAHGENMETLLKNHIFKESIEDNMFEKIIFLDSKKKGKIYRTYNVNEKFA